MLRFVEVPVGEGGTVACTRCAPRSQVTYLPVDEVHARVEAAVSAWSGPGGANVSLAGAEPFGHPDLPAIVAHAVRAGVSRLRVETSGGGLGHGGNAEGAQAAGVLHARVTLLGSEGVHDALAGAPGLYDAACEGMRAWAAAAARSGARTFLSGLLPVCDHNAGEAPAAVAAFARSGAREVVLRLEASADAVRCAPWVAAACETGTVNRVWVRVEGAELPEPLALHLTRELQGRDGA